ncbi:protein kinase [Massilia violaceinigra]|uniref:non-specific serine/threonine protein kinase n=1 Tax=Massilia violaceinigra TaxID=2045208 RepID=A0ABY4A8E5_9BURK|nr:serine/threonine-protein kinase [Massilia violaceinigra]UOD28883.1 protein kinase [Massilia violaceinigra]
MERNLQDDEQGPGHYQLKRLLGEGGFGQVYEAWDSKLQRIIAIKRLKPQLLSSRPDNLLDEARLAASLRHPAFVRIFSIEGDAAEQSIIMEFVDGCTLREAGKRGPMPEAQVLGIVEQVADAMCEAHDAKLIHGDLKPANLMLEPGGQVRIMDFGLARKIDPQATESVVFDQTEGTIAYLAPELMMGSTLSPQSDVYALGVVMYELLTGTRPFSHLSGLALAAAHIQSSSKLWPFAPDASPAVTALVRAMTARQPEERIASMQAVREAVRGVRDGAGVPAAPPAATPAPAPARAPFGKKKAALAIGIGALVVALGGAVASGRLGDWYQQNDPFFSEAKAMESGLAALKTFERRERLEVAIRSFSAILEHNPKHAAAAAGLSFAYCFKQTSESRDDTWLKRADVSAQLAIKLNDQLALGYAAQSTVRTGQRRMPEALKLADQALRLDPLNWFGLVAKSNVLTRMRRYPEAEQVLRQALARYPAEHVFYDLLGTLYFDQGKLKPAEQAFRQSIKLEPDSVSSYSNLSLTLQRQNRMDESLQVLQQGLQVRPTGPLYTNLGNALFTRGDYVGAAEAFERAVAPPFGNNYDYLHWANLGDTLRWIPGREDDARKAYQQALGMLKPILVSAPGEPTLHSRMGLYQARLGQRAAAIDHTRRAIDLVPADPNVRFRAAMAYELLGERDQALVELTMAREKGYPIHLINAEPDLIELRRDRRYFYSTTESDK